MADITIDEATQDTDITGIEKIPMSDAQVAKFATTAQIKEYVIGQIEAIAATGAVDVSADKVYLLKEGSLKPIAADVLSAAVLNYGFGKAGVASINGNEIVGVKDSAAQKTITISALKTWLQNNMTVTTDIDIGSKTAAGAIENDNLLVVAQSGTNKKLTMANLTAWTSAKFKDYLESLTAANALTNNDVLYIINGNEAKKCTLAQIIAQIGSGDVVAPDTHVVGNIPAWSNTSKKLTSGYGVASQISSTPSTEKIPTEAAVSTALTELDNEKVDKETGKGLSTNDYTSEEKTKLAGLENAEEMVGATEEEDGESGLVPAPASEDIGKFLKGDGTWSDVGIPDGVVTTESTGNAGKIPVWGTPQTGTDTKELVAGKSVVTAIGATPADAGIPTEKAVADHVAAMTMFTKIALETIASGSTKTLVNRAVHYYGIATGGSYTLTVPAAVEGRSREFYVAFVQSGTQSATSTVNLSSSIPIHGSGGTVTSLSITKDVAGNSNAYHIYHFIEDAGQIWCVNLFAAAESGSGSEFTGATSSADGTSGLVPSPSAGEQNLVLHGDGEWREPGDMRYKNESITASSTELEYEGGESGIVFNLSGLDFSINFAEPYSGRVYVVEMIIVCGASLPEDITITFDGEDPQYLWFDGSNTSLVDMLAVGKATHVRFVVVKNGTGAVMVSKVATYTPAS